MTNLINIGRFPNDPTADLLRTAFQKVNANVRTKLTADATFHVATTGSDTAGDGSSGAPWATLQYASDVICKTLDLDGYQANVAISDGTYSGVMVDTPYSSQLARSGLNGGFYNPLIVFQGNASNASAVVLTYMNHDGQSIIFAGNNTFLAAPLIKNCTLDGSAATDGVMAYSQNGGLLIVGDNTGGTMRFIGASAGSAGDAMAVTGVSASLWVSDNIQIVGGNFDAIIRADFGGLLLTNAFLAGNAFTLTGNPAVTNFADAGGFGKSGAIEDGGATYSGAMVGRKFTVNGPDAYIYVGSGPGGAGSSNLSLFPGSTPGVILNDGRYAYNGGVLGRISSGGVTVANLPSASTQGAGARSLVTDATVTTFATTVVGGGSNSVPVYSDGTNWKIG